MIRKYARLDVRPETVRELFHDVESWHSWMPTVEALEVLEKSRERYLVEVRQRLTGRVQKQTLELTFDPLGYTERQVSGALKRWAVTWQFTEPPAGRGTIASARIDLDLGFSGLLVPRRTIQRTIDRLFQSIVERAEARARRRESLRAATVWGVVPGQKLSIRVYETPTELEVWVGERRFALPVAE